MNILRTEKREAVVGDRILITNAITVFQDAEFHNGKIFTVCEVNSDKSVYVENFDFGIDYREYEVIVAEEVAE